MVYAPGTQEKDLTKLNMSLQQNAAQNKTNATDIATNTTNIVTNTAAIASINATLPGQIATLQGQTAGYEAAWSTYTPTINSTGGTFTTVSATGRYLQIGKLIHLNIEVTITTVGTATGQVQATLPFNPKNSQGAYILAGRERVVTGKMLYGSIASSTNKCSMTFYDNTSAIAATAVLVCTGIYEAA